MQQFSLYFAFILVILIGNSEAKRGCSLYGHSCYGGHGKRSTLPRLADGLSLDAAPSPLLKLLRDTSRPYPPSLVADYPDLYENDNEPDNLRVVKDFNRAIFTLLRQLVRHLRHELLRDGLFLAENRMRNPADVENHQNPDANEFYKTTTANNNNQIHNI